MDIIPAIPSLIRDELTTEYALKGLSWLQQQVQLHDPDFWLSAEQKNPHRLLRALEVKLATGKSILKHRPGQKKLRPFKLLKIGLELPRPLLVDRINQRVDQMITDGLLQEVIQLLPYRGLKALQTVGYSELFQHLDGLCTLNQAIEHLKTNTRQYAKRQQTWFSKDKDVIWQAADNELFDRVLEIIHANSTNNLI